MKTLKDLREEITRVSNIDVKGFDSAWVIMKFARDQALINIKLIKPYTDKYELIVRFLVTGKDADAATDIAEDAATDAAAYAIAAYAATYGTDADADADADAYGTAAYAAAYAATAAAYATDYTKAIASLNTLANEYLALLPKD